MGRQLSFKNSNFQRSNGYAESLLQKPSKISKDKYLSHWTLTAWVQNKITELLRECQESSNNNNKNNNNNNNNLSHVITYRNTIGPLSKDYPEHVRKGNVYSAMKLLTNNLKNGILPLDNKTLEYLCQEHPTPSPPKYIICLLYTSPSPRDKRQSRMPSSA